MHVVKFESTFAAVNNLSSLVVTNSPNSHPHKSTNMRFAQPLDALAQAANNETIVQEPAKKKRKHIHAASSHTRVVNESRPDEPAPDASALSRSRSHSPPASAPASFPHLMDHRVFFEALSDSLHGKNENRIGKIITNDRFACESMRFVTQ